MSIPKSEFAKLRSLLEKTAVPKADNKNRAKTAGANGRTVYMGPRLRGDKTKLSVRAESHPEIYKETKRTINKHAPIKVSAFMLNHNYVTKPHTDKLNKGKSVVIAFGDYEGGDLIVEGKKVNTKHRPATLQPKVKHWNEPIKKGNRYSIVGFNV